MKKLLSSIASILLSAVVLYAQHEFSVYGSTGYSYIDYSLNAAAISPENGSTYQTGGKLQSGVGLGYTYSFTPRWGIVSGVELKYFTADAEVSNFADRAGMVYSYDGRTEEMYFNSSLSGFKENQKATILQIPLLAEYRFSIDDEGSTWFVAAGAKFGFGVSGKYTATANRLVTTGYFPEWEQTFRNMPEHGFVARDNVAWSDKLKFGFNASFTVETGARISLTPRLGIYTGIYFDLGSANILSKSTTGVVSYRPDDPETFAYNSILRTTQQSSGEQFVIKINLLSIGVKLKVGITR
jgi:hypothetical protein